MRIWKGGLTKTQHATRKGYVGGSDAKIIMSGDDAAVLRLWGEKRGEIEPEDLSTVLQVQMGVATEELNRCWFERMTGLTIEYEGEQQIMTTHGFPMGVTLDGLIRSENAVFEAKHVGGFEPFETVVQRYMPQVYHSMIVTGATKGYLAIFEGTGDWRSETVVEDPFYADALIEQERKFWECVLSGKPPRLPPPPPPPLPEASRRVDMTGNNLWASRAADWLKNKEASKTFDAAAKELKALVEADVREASGHGIIIKRDKARKLTIKEG